MIFESALYLVMCAGAPESARSLSTVSAVESPHREDSVDVRLWEALFRELLGPVMFDGERMVHQRRTP